MAKKIDPTNFRANFHHIEITQTKPSNSTNGWTVRTGSVGGKMTVVKGFRGTTLGEVRGLVNDWKSAGIDTKIPTTVYNETGSKMLISKSTIGKVEKNVFNNPKAVSDRLKANSKLTVSQERILSNLDGHSVGGIGANDTSAIAQHLGMKSHDVRKDLESLERRGYVEKSRFNRALWTPAQRYKSTELYFQNKEAADKATKIREASWKKNASRKHVFGK
jgi:hypothetical protein